MKRFFIVLLALVCVSAFAAPIDSTMPDWLNGIIQFISQFSWGGEFVVKALKVVAFVAALLTCVTAIIDGLVVFFKAIGQAKYLSFLQKIADLLDKVRPWIAYFSMYNVQKK